MHVQYSDNDMLYLLAPNSVALVCSGSTVTNLRVHHTRQLCERFVGS